MTRNKNIQVKGILLVVFSVLVNVKIPTNVHCADLAIKKKHLLQNKMCIGCDLRGVDLVRANLSGGNLSGANLDGAKFCLADLSGVNFSNASLRNTQFCGADISNAVFIGADISGSSFSGVYKKNAVFYRTKYEEKARSKKNYSCIKKRKDISNKKEEEQKLAESELTKGTVQKTLFRFKNVKVRD